MSAFLLGKGFRADMGTCIRKLVLLKLIDACEDDGSRIFPAMETVARAAQCSKRQVQREIRAMMDVGLLRLVREGGSGRRSTNEYHMDLAMLDRIAAEGWEAVAGSVEAKGDRVSPLDNEAKGDTGDTGRVTPETPKGDNGSHTTPPDSSPDSSSERERASADEREGKDTGNAGKPSLPEGQRAAASEADEPADAEERPETAAFQKRVMRFANGRGFAAGPWPDWDTSSPGHIARCFARLSTGERAEAESWRDAYLLDIAARRKRPVPVANFLRDRLWTGLEHALLARAEKAKAAKLSPDEQARPDGWEKLLGPVGMAFLFGKLLAGPEDAEAASRPFMTEPVLRQAWPAVWWWQAVQRQKGGAVVGPVWDGLKDAMEPVPQGTAVLAEWRQFFDERGWPWLNVFDRTDVVYCPKGGPGGLEAFERAMREAEEKGGGDEHGNRSQAAE